MTVLLVSLIFRLRNAFCLENASTCNYFLNFSDYQPEAKKPALGDIASKNNQDQQR